MDFTKVPLSIDFKYYYQLYHENKEKIHMKAEDGVEQHPINKEAVARWIERIKQLEDEEERNFYEFLAKAFASILETSYISYTIFLTTVNMMAEEILQKMLTGKYSSIFFVISSEREKSNLWVSLLCMDYWHNHPSFFKLSSKLAILSSAVASFLRGEEESSPLFKKCLFLHFDDMSYSGGQVAQFIKTFWTPPFKELTQAQSFKLTSPNVEYYLAIPYITDIAKDHIIRNNRGVKVLSTTKIIPNFLKQIERYHSSLEESEQKATASYIPLIEQMCEKDLFFYSGQSKHSYYFKERYKFPNMLRKGIWAFHCSYFKTLIYFDHKLADEVSTFQKVLYFGSYPINTNENSPYVSYSAKKKLPACEHESLIQGCSIPSKVLDSMAESHDNACRDYIQYGSKQWNINQRVICPKTFYKGISYTFSVNIILDKKRNPIEKPYILTKNSTLYSNLDYYFSQVLYSSFDNLYPEKVDLEDSKKIEIFETKYIQAYKKTMDDMDAYLAPAHPWQNYYNIPNLPLNNTNKPKGYMKRILGSFLPFYGGTRSIRSKKLRKQKTRKHSKV